MILMGADFDGIILRQNLSTPKFFTPNYFTPKNFFTPKYFLRQKHFLRQNYFTAKIFYANFDRLKKSDIVGSLRLELKKCFNFEL